METFNDSTNVTSLYVQSSDSTMYVGRGTLNGAPCQG